VDLAACMGREVPTASPRGITPSCRPSRKHARPTVTRAIAPRMRGRCSGTWWSPKIMKSVR